jgi:hypothetical protein
VKGVWIDTEIKAPRSCTYLASASTLCIFPPVRTYVGTYALDFAHVCNCHLSYVTPTFLTIITPPTFYATIRASWKTQVTISP